VERRDGEGGFYCQVRSRMVTSRDHLFRDQCVMESFDFAEILFKPIFIGFYIGLVLTLIVFIRAKTQQRRLRKQVEELRRHIQTKLEIEAEATERLKGEIDRLKSESENLRVTLQSYMDRPGRREMRQLQLYQRAVDILIEKAPGFAQSWQSALKDGEQELSQAEKGIIPFFRKLLPGSGAHTPSQE
jgi:uncharacterized membrane protein YciS (DUF1049 family)